MKRVQKIYCLGLALASVIPLVGCVEPSPYPPGPPAYVAYGYDYYPNVEVYYAPDRHLYYWRDGDAWRSGPRAPEGITLGAHVNVKLDSSEPSKHHEEIRARYPAHVAGDHH